jgi:hypothetical protein
MEPNRSVDLDQILIRDAYSGRLSQIQSACAGLDLSEKTSLSKGGMQVGCRREYAPDPACASSLSWAVRRNMLAANDCIRMEKLSPAEKTG